MEIAVFGLGKMGMQIAKRLHKSGFRVLGWNRSEAPRKEFESFILEKNEVKSKAEASLDDICNDLKGAPRIFWVMLPQEAVEDFLFNNSLLGQV